MEFFNLSALSKSNDLAKKLKKIAGLKAGEIIALFKILHEEKNTKTTEQPVHV